MFMETVNLSKFTTKDIDLLHLMANFPMNASFKVNEIDKNVFIIQYIKGNRVKVFNEPFSEQAINIFNQLLILGWVLISKDAINSYSLDLNYSIGYEHKEY